MAHDFAKQRAARANRSGQPAHAPWLWLVSGIVIGTLVSFLVYLATLTPPPQQAATVSATRSTAMEPIMVTSLASRGHDHSLRLAAALSAMLCRWRAWR